MDISTAWPHIIGWGISLLVYVATLSFTYGRQRSKIDSLTAKVEALEDKIDGMQSTGSGILCRFHEERLSALEKALSERIQRAEAQYGELKELIEVNQKLLLEQKSKFL